MNSMYMPGTATDGSVGNVTDKLPAPAGGTGGLGGGWGGQGGGAGGNGGGGGGGDGGGGGGGLGGDRGGRGGVGGGRGREGGWGGDGCKNAKTTHQRQVSYSSLSLQGMHAGTAKNGYPNMLLGKKDATAEASFRRLPRGCNKARPATVNDETLNVSST
jgi:hypothetical protein